MTTFDLIEELHRRSQVWETQQDGRVVSRPIHFVDDSCGSAYGRSMMELSIRVVPGRGVDPHDLWWAGVFFTGVDDGNWSLVGPEESRDAAVKRASRAQTLLGPDRLSTVPTKAHADEIAHLLGMHVNI